MLIANFSFVSLVAGPFLNLIGTFGEEFGWTGYLLPSLLPLGRWRAVGIYGVIWGLWHAPIIAGGFHYAGHPIIGILFFCAFTTAIGLIQCSLLLRYRSVLLTSFLHGAINAEAMGIWLLLVTGVSTLWGGTVGLVGILVFGCFGIWLLAGQRKTRPERSPAEATAARIPITSEQVGSAHSRREAAKIARVERSETWVRRPEGRPNLHSSAVNLGPAQPRRSS